MRAKGGRIEDRLLDQHSRSKDGKDMLNTRQRHRLLVKLLPLVVEAGYFQLVVLSLVAHRGVTT